MVKKDTTPQNKMAQSPNPFPRVPRTNGGSLLEYISAGIVGGKDIRITDDGVDEQAAVEALVELVESGFSDENR